MKVYSPEVLAQSGSPPPGFASKVFRSPDLAGHLVSVQVSPDDCTGCRVCVEVCPAKSNADPGHRSLNMTAVPASRAAEFANWAFFRSIPATDRSFLPHDSVKGAAVLEPLFGFSHACPGCGQTPYLRLLSQLFGDRLVIVDATGCSSMDSGTPPPAPAGSGGPGPARANLAYEDNAEFGLGVRLGLDAEARLARSLLGALAGKVGAGLAAAILEADQDGEGAVLAQRGRVTELKSRLADLHRGGPVQSAARLASLADCLVHQSVWVVGGDRWAYGTGSGGLDQVLASGADVNVLVLDTGTYARAGGRASTSVPGGAPAAPGPSRRPAPTKDWPGVARSYGNVYVAQVAIGANDVQTIKALVEAEAYQGPSVVIAYASCTRHGAEMARSVPDQKAAVRSGSWPLFRFHPRRAAAGPDAGTTQTWRRSRPRVGQGLTLGSGPEHPEPENTGPEQAGPRTHLPSTPPGGGRNRRNEK